MCCVYSTFKRVAYRPISNENDNVLYKKEVKGNVQKNGLKIAKKNYYTYLRQHLQSKINLS